jgi:hypothetical protein
MRLSPRRLRIADALGSSCYERRRVLRRRLRRDLERSCDSARCASPRSAREPRVSGPLAGSARPRRPRRGGRRPRGRNRRRGVAPSATRLCRRLRRDLSRGRRVRAGGDGPPTVGRTTNVRPATPHDEEDWGRRDLVRRPPPSSRRPHSGRQRGRGHRVRNSGTPLRKATTRGRRKTRPALFEFVRLSRSAAGRSGRG